MRKVVILLFLVCLFGQSQVNAQHNYRYQGDVEVGFAAGIGTFGFDRVNVHSTHGVRFNEYFFLGAGTGLDCFTNYIYDLPELSLPLFLNTKGYLPVSPKVNMFLSLSIGASIGMTEGVKGLSGLLFTPAVGTSIKVKDHKAINISLGYNMQKWGDSGITLNNDAVALKVGFQF